MASTCRTFPSCCSVYNFSTSQGVLHYILGSLALCSGVFTYIPNVHIRGIFHGWLGLGKGPGVFLHLVAVACASQ